MSPADLLALAERIADDITPCNSLCGGEAEGCQYAAGREEVVDAAERGDETEVRRIAAECGVSVAGSLP